MNDADDLVSDFMQLEAERREALHVNSAARRPLSNGYELVGLAGEVEFATTYNQPLNLLRRRGGDGGIDFTIPLAFTVDVKCLRDASDLLVEEGTVTADIYVLAEYFDKTKRATLVGWEYGSIVAKVPARAYPREIVNHIIPREALRPMSDIRGRLMRLARDP
jgi:hypothetical protein